MAREVTERQKQKLLNELHKGGTLLTACEVAKIRREELIDLKVRDKQFRYALEIATEVSEDRNADIAHTALIELVQKRNFSAIKFFLTMYEKNYAKRGDEYQSWYRNYIDEVITRVYERKNASPGGTDALPDVPGVGEPAEQADQKPDDKE